MLPFCSKLLAGLYELPKRAKRKVFTKKIQLTDTQSLSAKSSGSTLADDETERIDVETLADRDENPPRGLKRSGSSLSVESNTCGHDKGSGGRASLLSDDRRKRQRRDEEIEINQTISNLPLPQVLSSTPSASRSISSERSSCQARASSSSLIMPPNIPARPAVPTPSHATARELSKSPPTRKRLKLSSLASSDSRPPPSNAAVPITRSPVIEVNPAVPAETPQSPPSVPLSLPERTLAPNGEATRVEVAYSKFYSEVLASPEHRDAIEAMARMIIKTHAWDKAYARYHVEARDMWPSNGRRKNRMAELLNTIQAEAHRCGLPAPVRHEISFARHDEKGFDEHDPRVATDERDPEVHYRFTRHWEPWQEQATEPCFGTVPSPSGDSISAWRRAVCLVGARVRKEFTSPAESHISPLAGGKRKRSGSLAGSSYSSSGSSSSSPSPRPSRYERDDEPPPRKRYRIKGPGVSDQQGYDPLRDDYARLSWVTLQQEYYDPPNWDDELKAQANRVFRETGGNRSHILGIYANRLLIRFCFFDRAGLVYTAPLDLRDGEDAARFVAGVISMSYLDAAGLGLERYLLRASSSAEAETESVRLQQKQGLFLDVGDATFHTDKLIHAEAICGRGTVVWEASPATPDANGKPIPASFEGVPQEVILKMSWQVVGMRSEDEMLKLAEERGVQGIARVYRSQVITRLSDGIRGRLVPPSMYADRELRVQVSGPRARPLYEVKDLDTFKAGFISLLHAHHELYTKTGILHRDISPNNLMVDRHDPRQAVLIDLDIAARVNDEGDPVDGHLLPVAGTLAFRAFDLLYPTQPLKAYYRHDLESFFWVLLWIAYHFRNGVYDPQPQANRFNRGFEDSWEYIRMLKEGFFSLTLQKIDPLPPTPLLDEWIVPLRLFLGSVYDCWRRPSLRRALPNASEATWGGQLTFASFMTSFIHDSKVYSSL